MRLNKYIASSSILSRRAADAAIAEGRVSINGQIAKTGVQVKPTDVILLNGIKLTPRSTTTTIALNKPIGYVCSRDGQGSATIYDLLPSELHHLKSVGRLDKKSSGLLLMTDDGDLAQNLTHPSRTKTKIYIVGLDKPLEPLHQQMISDYGISLEDGISRFIITKLESGDILLRPGYEGQVSQGIRKNTPYTTEVSPPTKSQSSTFNLQSSNLYEIQMTEGRNRQIRRTFAALGYEVTYLHRTHFGSYSLGELPLGKFRAT